MQIEAGKYYKTRDGRRVGPLKHDTAGWLTDENNKFSWSIDHGERLIRNSGRDDLISEWVEAGPVREVTRVTREIVEGTYGRVGVSFVNSIERGYVCLHLTEIKSQPFPSSMNATELRAAAAVLLELARALSDD